MVAVERQRERKDSAAMILFLMSALFSDGFLSAAFHGRLGKLVFLAGCCLLVLPFVFFLAYSLLACLLLATVAS